MARISKKVLKNQKKAVFFVQEQKNAYKKACQSNHEKVKSIYEAVMTYVGKKEQDWDSTTKMNFANQVESLVTARITAKNPKFIVSFKQNPVKIAEKFFGKEVDDEMKKTQEYQEFEDDVFTWAESVQEYLNFAFTEYNFNRAFRLLTKSLVRYGNCYGESGYKVEKLWKKRNGKIEEMGVISHPFLENVPPLEVLYDPRYSSTDESPGVIRIAKKVRLTELRAMDGILNLDKIKLESKSDNTEEYKITYVNDSNDTIEERANTLTVSKYQGYYTPEKGEEGLYEIWTVNDKVLIKLDPIAEKSIKSAACFEDPEQAFGIGYVEPMLQAEEEYNFKLNSANQSINQSLNRSWFWDPNSGIDPRALSRASAPGAIIPVTNGIDQARNGLEEIEYRPIPGEYFANQNEIKRDMQSLSFTVDTSAGNSSQGFTNTATGVRARMFESNIMYADTLKHIEEMLNKLAYNIIDKLAENATDDIIIGRLGKGRFKWAKPAVFEDSPLRYAINVEVGSSSFDSVENRREEALSLWTIAKDAKESGVNVDLDKVLEDVMLTYEKKDISEYIKKDMNDLLALLGSDQQGVSATSGQEREIIENKSPSLDNPEDLTRAVAGGKI